MKCLYIRASQRGGQGLFHGLLMVLKRSCLIYEGWPKITYWSGSPGSCLTMVLKAEGFGRGVEGKWPTRTALTWPA